MLSVTRCYWMTGLALMLCLLLNGARAGSLTASVSQASGAVMATEVYETAVVLSVGDEAPSKEGDHVSITQTPTSDLALPVHVGKMQTARVKITSGPLSGQVFSIENILGDNPAFNIPLEQGSRVIVSIDTLPNGKRQVYVADRERAPVLALLFSVFVLALFWVGGRRATAHFALAFVLMLLVLNGLIPAMVQMPYSTPIAVGLVLLYLLASAWVLRVGEKRVPLWKIAVPMLACVLVMLVLMALVVWLAPLQGFFDENLASLWFTDNHFDFTGMLYAMTMLMGLGFIFYLCRGMVADTRDEVAAGDLEARQLKKRLMESGRERLGPMLAMQWLMAAGIYLPMMIQTLDVNLTKLVNLESVATVLAFVLVVSLSLVLSVPVFAVLFSRLTDKKPSAV